jgi:hypothetical protein
VHVQIVSSYLAWEDEATLKGRVIGAIGPFPRGPLEGGAKIAKEYGAKIAKAQQEAGVRC